MPQRYQVEALCNSWKCRGGKRTFQREMWQEQPTYNTPMGQRLGSGPLERAYCTNCGTYVHIPISGKGWKLQIFSERPIPITTKKKMLDIVNDLDILNGTQSEENKPTSEGKM